MSSQSQSSISSNKAANAVHFTFPLDINQYSQLQSLDELKNKLKKQSKMLGIDCQFWFKSHGVKIDLRYTIAKCFFCQSYIRYKYNEQKKLIVTAYNNHHTHISKPFSQQTAIKQIQRYLGKLNHKQIKERIQLKYNLQKTKIQQLINSIRYHNISFRLLKDKLVKQNYIIYQEAQSSQNSVNASFISPQMLKDYYCYGKYACLQRLEISAQKILPVYFLLFGVSPKRQIIPFCFLLVHSVQSLLLRLQIVFKKLNITQILRIEYDNILENQFFKGQIVYSPQSVVTYYQSQLFSLGFSSKNLIKIIEAKTQAQYQKSILQCCSTISKLEQKNQVFKIFYYFIQQSQKYCQSQIPPIKVSLSFGRSKIKRFQKSVSQKISRKCNYPEIIQKILLKLSNLNSSQNNLNTKSLNFIQIHQLEKLNNKLSYYVLQTIHKQLALTIQSEIQFVSVKHFRVSIKQCYFNVYFACDKKWICQCGASFITGLPCQHQLKCCIFAPTPIINQIDNQHIINIPQQAETKTQQQIN